MQILVEISEADRSQLEKIGRAESVSSEELAGRAITSFLAARRRRQAFGLWADNPQDGLEYQDRIRREW